MEDEVSRERMRKDISSENGGEQLLSQNEKSRLIRSLLFITKV
jgi:hypothetical protein